MSNIKRWNVCVRKEFESKGEKKVQWPQVGKLTYFPPSGDREGGFKLEIPIFGQTQFYVFKDEPKEKVDEFPATSVPEASAEVNAEDVPF